MNTTKLVAGTLLMGVGMAAGGTTLAAAAAGVGVNWAGEGAAGLWAGLRRPPEQALGRAYAQAIRDGVGTLQDRYRSTVDGSSDGRAFALVAACADALAQAEFPDGPVSPETTQQVLAGGLTALLHGHDERQVAFLQRELLPACAVAFQQELIRDEAAWRAFHGQILQGLAVNSAALMARMENFAQLLADWATNRDTLREMLRDLVPPPPPAPQPPLFDNRGMRVGGSVHQAGGNQYFGSAHAEGSGTATVINNLGGSPAPDSSRQREGATLLFLAANPVQTERLELDREARHLAESLRASRGRLTLAQEWAVRTTDLLDALLRTRPRVVHFAGHGGEGGLILAGADGQPAILSGEALAALLAAASGVGCVCLNACWSDELAAGLLAAVPCVVGMAGSVDDRAAIAFADGFYRVLGQGESVASAVAGGQAQMLAAGIPPALTGHVRLLTAAGVDASALTVVGIERG